MLFTEDGAHGLVHDTLVILLVAHCVVAVEMREMHREIHEELQLFTFCVVVVIEAV